MRQSIIALAAASALSAGSAHAETRAVPLEPFSALDISSGIEAGVSVGPAQSVVVEAADPRIIDELQLRVEGGTLKAYFDWSIWDLFKVGADRRVRLTITVPELRAVNASAGSHVEAEGSITGESLRFTSSSGSGLEVQGIDARSVSLNASSGSKLRVSGSCGDGKANASSGSNLDASGLKCSTMDANASSGSDLDVFATASIKANASSGSDLTVRGNPAEIEQKSSSGASIRLR